MASKAEKFSISLSAETLAQMDYIKHEYMHVQGKLAFSQLVAFCVSIAYFNVLEKLNNEAKE